MNNRSNDTDCNRNIHINNITNNNVSVKANRGSEGHVCHVPWAIAHGSLQRHTPLPAGLRTQHARLRVRRTHHRALLAVGVPVDIDAPLFGLHHHKALLRHEVLLGRHHGRVGVRVWVGV